MEKRTPITFLLIQDRTGDQFRIFQALSSTFANEVVVFNPGMSIIRYLSQEVKNTSAGQSHLAFLIIVCPCLDAEVSAEIVSSIKKDDRDQVRKTPVYVLSDRTTPRVAILKDSSSTDAYTENPFDITSFLEWLASLPSIKIDKLPTDKFVLRIG
ncbi:MAG: hypothetical protein JWM04_1386 [Verrucomicrobiales bacterium]|nr:hypothetical protein [Verrucomicrobiales bacterium]